jgi:putative ABC transport system substrate-binding protein
MKRRPFLALAGATLAGATGALPARAQSVPRVGFLVAGDPEPSWSQFRQAMAERGYVEGRTVGYVYRAGDTSADTLDRLAGSIVETGVDVIVTELTPAMTAAARRTSTIPIVFDSAAPEAASVDNIARPGGNLTGVYNPSSTIAGKCLQLFHEALPRATAFGLMMNLRDPFHVPMQREVEAVSRAAGIACAMIGVAAPDALALAFDDAVRQGLAGVVVQPSLGLKAAAQFALDHRMPTISLRRSFVEFGGLMSYGASTAAIYRIMASQVDRILKGARPADLPLQQPTLFELVANSRTAKALDFTFPPLFLARIDEMIG